jgi:hypothetical protein
MQQQRCCVCNVQVQARCCPLSSRKRNIMKHLIDGLRKQFMLVKGSPPLE